MCSQASSRSTVLPDSLRDDSRANTLHAGLRKKTLFRGPLRQLSIRAYGVGFIINANCASLLRDCSEYFPPSWEREGSLHADVQYRVIDRSQPGALASSLSLYRNGVAIFRCDDRVAFLERFGSTLALDLANISRRFVFLHAGVVGWGASAILIPGRSFAGKTTLVAELVRAGATYYSDDFAAIDHQGYVHPYLRPLQIRDPYTYRQTRCSVESLGGIPAKEPLPIGLVIFSKFQEGASWLPQELTPGIACLQMLDNTISARSAPAIALTTLKQVASRATSVSGLRGDAPQLIQWIIANFSRSRTFTSPSA